LIEIEDGLEEKSTVAAGVGKGARKSVLAESTGTAAFYSILVASI
jgi:hypothetical protein